MTLNSGSPVFLVFLGCVLPAETQRGAFLFFCFPALFVFCWGLRPVWGACFPIRKSVSRPSFRGVCVRSGRAPCHHFYAGGPRATGWRGPTKTHPVCCANVPAEVIQGPFGPLPESLLLSCFPVQVTRVKLSDVRAETHRTRDLSGVLETHQLYSKD